MDQNKTVVLSTQRLYFRDENGEYFSTDVLSDKSTEERITDIEAAGAAVESEVRQTFSDFKRDIVLVQEDQPTTEDNRIWVDSDEFENVNLATMEDLEAKTSKTRIDFDGTNFKIGNQILNYKQLHDIHLIKPDFAFVVYGDRAYLLAYVQDDTNAMREMRWESTIATDTAVKTSGIYAISNDGINIANVTIRDINSENQGNKVSAITAENRNNVNYPSVKAVTDYVKKTNTSVTSRLDNLEAAAKGKLYREDVDSTEAYEKPIADDVLPWASLDKVGCKTLVWNQGSISPNFESTVPSSLAGSAYATIETENGVSTITIAQSNSANGFNLSNLSIHDGFKGDHVYALSLDITYDTEATTQTQIAWLYSTVATSVGTKYITPQSNYTHVVLLSKIIPKGTRQLLFYVDRLHILAPGDKVSIKNVQFFDLTAMFGVGNESAAGDALANLFPADYYPYSAPTLMSFGADKVVSSTGQRINLSPLVQKYFQTGMRSAGTVYDEIDLERGVAVQRVGEFIASADVPWAFISDGESTRAFTSAAVNKANAAKAVCDKFVYGDASRIGQFDCSVTYIRFNMYGLAEDKASAVAWLDAHRPVVYYELAQYIETPIDPADLADLAVLNVEAGGSLTFENQHGNDFQVPLPNQETFLIDIRGESA